MSLVWQQRNLRGKGQGKSDLANRTTMNHGSAQSPQRIGADQDLTPCKVRSFNLQQGFRECASLSLRSTGQREAHSGMPMSRLNERTLVFDCSQCAKRAWMRLGENANGAEIIS